MTKIFIICNPMDSRIRGNDTRSGMMKNTNGFTLIELTVSFAVLGIFLNFIYFFFLHNLNLWKDKSNQLEIMQNARFAFEKMTLEIRSAKTILNTPERPSNDWQASFDLGADQVTYELIDGMLYRRLTVKSPLLSRNYVINQTKIPTIALFSFPEEKLVRINIILDLEKNRELKLCSAIKLYDF
jgi:prepilin-type N-terminal cleavage/methylation domain-containing protein